MLFNKSLIHALILLVVYMSNAISGEIPSEYLELWDMSTSKKLWEAEGLSQPESIVYHSRKDILYVSNNGIGQDDGFISKLNADGEILEREWIANLSSPSGMSIEENILYVADVNTLLAIDVDTGEIYKKYSHEGAIKFKDVTVADNGQVFVSDPSDNAIYKLNEGKFDLWVKSESLNSPTGLLAEKNHIVVATSGYSLEDANAHSPGNLKSISFRNQNIKDVGNGSPVGYLNSVQYDGVGCYLSTDHITGRFFHVWPDGRANLIMDVPPSAADIAYVKELKQVFIPIKDENKLTAYYVIY